MFEIRGNLWQQPGAKCITTNGNVNRRGEAVMGRGCALQAKQRYPKLAQEFAARILAEGNHVYYFPAYQLYTFPVKHNWHDKADLKLIERSAHELVAAADQYTPGAVTVLPRPGCGNGQLSWSDVYPVIEPILTGDRFVIVDLAYKLPLS